MNFTTKHIFYNIITSISNEIEAIMLDVEIAYYNILPHNITRE